MSKIRTSNAVILQARKFAATLTPVDRANRDRVVLWCRASRLPEPELEFQFHEFRKWRFDYAWQIGSDLKLALEQEGAVWLHGRHTRGKGFSDDLVKYAEAAILGWTVLRATPEQITNGTAFEWLTRIFQARFEKDR